MRENAKRRATGVAPMTAEPRFTAAYPLCADLAPGSNAPLGMGGLQGNTAPVCARGSVETRGGVAPAWHGGSMGVETRPRDERACAGTRVPPDQCGGPDRHLILWRAWAAERRRA